MSMALADLSRAARLLAFRRAEYLAVTTPSSVASSGSLLVRFIRTPGQHPFNQICTAPPRSATNPRQQKPNAHITFLHTFHDFLRPAPRRALSYSPAGVSVHDALPCQLVAVRQVKTPTSFSGVRRCAALNGIQARRELSPGPNNNQGLVRPVVRG